MEENKFSVFSMLAMAFTWEVEEQRLESFSDTICPFPARWNKV